MTDEQRTEAEEIEEMEEVEEGSSRRSFMKKGAVAAGAVALGTAASAGSAAANSGDQWLVFTDEYYPRAPWVPVSQLPQTTVVNILGLGTTQEITQPDEYSGYIIQYQFAGGNPGPIAMIFTRNGTLNVNSNARQRFTNQAQVFSASLNLLQTTQA